MRSVKYVGNLLLFNTGPSEGYFFLLGHIPEVHCTFQSPPNSCRTPQDSAGLQAKVLILVASPAKLGRVGQSLEELGRT